jgi:hypothetical protein
MRAMCLGAIAIGHGDVKSLIGIKAAGDNPIAVHIGNMAPIIIDIKQKQAATKSTVAPRQDRMP